MSSSASNGKNDEERMPLYIPDVGRVNPRAIGSVYGMPTTKKQPEYLPYNARGRDVMGRLFFNSGAFWLSGFTAGGVYGFQEGWRGAASPIMRIRFNSVMNGMSRRGSTFGNALGVIGTTFYQQLELLDVSCCNLETLITFLLAPAFYHTAAIWVADHFELEVLTGSELATPAFAGFTTGALFKCTAGPRGAALAAVLGTSICQLSLKNLLI